jgi:transcriptional regulator with XRE-family HTH domain
MDIKKLFGKRLKALRETHGLTREELAAACDLSPANIAKLESADRFVSAESLEALCKALKAKPHDFFLPDNAGRKVAAKDQLDMLLENQDERTVRMIKDVAARILKDMA